MPTPEHWVEEAKRLRRFLEEVEKIEGVRVEGSRIYIGGKEEEDGRDDRSS